MESPQQVPPPRKPTVGIETFASLDIRAGVVVTVEAFPEARKPAWKLRVDFGPAIGVLSTSAQVTNYSEDELVGRHVVGVINLGTRRIAGFRSEFLMLGAIEDDCTVALLAPDTMSAPGLPVA